MGFGRKASALQLVAQTLVLSISLPAIALAQKSSDSQRGSLNGPHPVIGIENPKPPSQKPHRKKDPAGPTVQLRYRIVPSTSGVTSARIEIWDRPDLLAKIPVKVAKTGEATWVDTSAPTPSRLDFTLIDPDAPRYCGLSCNDPDTEAQSVAVAGDVPPSFTSDPVRVRAGAETMSVDLDGRFFTSSTKVLLAEPTPKMDVWKAWEFLPVEYVEASKIRVTIPWSYLASPRKLVLWPFNLDEVEAAQGNGLPLNGTEQKTPVGGGAREILYVVSSSSPVLRNLEPAQLSADAADRIEAKVILRGEGFTLASMVLVGRDPLEDNPSVVIASRYVSPEALEIHIPTSQLRFSNLAYSEPGPIRIWVRNAGNGLQISESRDIQILPTAKLPPPPPRGVILAVSPSPLPLMTANGPPGEEVAVVGSNFRPNDSIIASADQGEKKQLPTQFVSSTELRASLPRQLWREHRVSYRFVIVTAQGERASELYEDEDAPETESPSAK
ncbi:MAG: hypothetical protein WAK24_18660 [Candidatus Acidiferrales bacterium]